MKRPHFLVGTLIFMVTLFLCVVEELFSFVSFLLPLKEESCCRVAASGASGRTGHRLGKTADGRALEGPSMLAMSSVCDSRRRFVGCGLYLFDIFNCTSSNC